MEDIPHRCAAHHDDEKGRQTRLYSAGVRADENSMEYSCLACTGTWSRKVNLALSLTRSEVTVVADLTSHNTESQAAQKAVGTSASGTRSGLACGKWKSSAGAIVLQYNLGNQVNVTLDQQKSPRSQIRFRTRFQPVFPRTFTPAASMSGAEAQRLSYTPRIRKIPRKATGVREAKGTPVANPSRCACSHSR